MDRGINILRRSRAQHSCQTPLCCHSLMCWPEAPEFSRLHKSLLLDQLCFNLHNHFLGEFSAQRKTLLQCSKLPSAFETSKSYDHLEIMQVDCLMAPLDDSYLKIPEKTDISVELWLCLFVLCRAGRNFQKSTHPSPGRLKYTCIIPEWCLPLEVFRERIQSPYVVCFSACLFSHSYSLLSGISLTALHQSKDAFSLVFCLWFHQWPAVTAKDTVDFQRRWCILT